MEWSSHTIVGGRAFLSFARIGSTVQIWCGHSDTVVYKDLERSASQHHETCQQRAITLKNQHIAGPLTKKNQNWTRNRKKNLGEFFPCAWCVVHRGSQTFWQETTKCIKTFLDTAEKRENVTDSRRGSWRKPLCPAVRVMWWDKIQGNGLHSSTGSLSFLSRSKWSH